MASSNATQCIVKKSDIITILLLEQDYKLSDTLARMYVI